MADTATAEKTATEQVIPPQAPQPPAVQRQRADIVAGGGVAPIIPRTVQEVAIVAGAILKAGLYPDSYTCKDPGLKKDEQWDVTKARVMIGIMKGAEVGLAPITALSVIAPINNRPCIYGDGAVALIQRSGVLEKMTIEEIGTIPGHSDLWGKFADDFGVEVKMWRKGQSEPYVGRFTVGDAKRAHLWGDTKRRPWIEYPRRQLKWRAFSWAARDGFADCLCGLSIAEEVMDLPQQDQPKTISTTFLDDEPPARAEAPVPEPEAKKEVEQPHEEATTDAPQNDQSAKSGSAEEAKTAQAESEPSDWEVICDDLVARYNDQFPSDREEFIADNIDQLKQMQQHAPAVFARFLKETKRKGL